MTKCSPDFLSLADDCLRQFAQTNHDPLSSILTADDLNAFQDSYPGFRAREFPPVKTLTLFMRQVASDTKSCRHALIQRRVLITDGSTLLMPDTEQNQNEYPQPSTQKKGLVSLFSESLS